MNLFLFSRRPIPCFCKLCFGLFFGRAYDCLFCVTIYSHKMQGSHQTLTEVSVNGPVGQKGPSQSLRANYQEMIIISQTSYKQSNFQWPKPDSTMASYLFLISSIHNTITNKPPLTQLLGLDILNSIF